MLADKTDIYQQSMPTGTKDMPNIRNHLPVAFLKKKNFPRILK